MAPCKKGNLKGGRNTRAHKPQANMPYAFNPIETIPFLGAKRATANKDYQFIVNLPSYGGNRPQLSGLHRAPWPVIAAARQLPNAQVCADPPCVKPLAKLW